MTGGKQPYLISFVPANAHHFRITSPRSETGGVGGTSSSTSGFGGASVSLPVELSTLEPLWNQEVNSLYGIGGTGERGCVSTGLGSDLGSACEVGTFITAIPGIDRMDLNDFDRVPHIPAANIRFLRYIGCGAFGKVWEGWLHVSNDHTERFEKVALKVRNVKSLTEAEFKREATLMHKYQHANIVCFHGVSFDSPGQQCLVLEMMEQGNLRDYLHKG
ncbi:unnamed protein product [Protopolystoma xenopodis]|uniref:Protein kinase domain-containing protein n=1 Tax=Protopolystoma xenopodis TaxID=117903 RepID=A0A448WDD7_9PLAT|nr:unnamed protein product [Protopolystoma xenopodis]